MKFMVNWRVHPEKRDAVFKAFANMTAEDDQRDLGVIKLIGRWHSVGDFTGVAICECDDPIAMASWALNWSGALDLETKLVLDDEETRALGQQKMAQEAK